MEIGFIGLGHMGFPMASRLVEAGHHVVAFDTSTEALDRLVMLGADPATSPADVGDRTATVLASLPSPAASIEVATGPNGVIAGAAAQRFVDFSTIGSPTAQEVGAALNQRGIASLDCPVSGGVSGAQEGALSLMVSGPEAEFRAVKPILDVLGKPIFVSTKPGAAQTMKLINNLMAATALAATAEVVVMGVKAGLDPSVVIDVLNASSGGTHASRDKFPRSVLPRTFDFGFATGLMVKDVRLCLAEAEALGMRMQLGDAVGMLWEDVLQKVGPDSDFTCVVQPIEEEAGVVVDGRTG
jgi:3-hydroxyisobutyrate dehydrogenase-like beta-hydroxyacid dehydrogenase